MKSEKTKTQNQQTIKIRPLSINKAFQGRRYKTSDYLAFERELFFQLRPLKDKLKDKISLSVTFGFSSRKSDIDNCLKPLLDILALKYGFDDSRIYRLSVKKDITAKGQEFISVEFG